MPKHHTPATPPAKPRCRLSGTDGNVFALASRVMKTLRQANQPDAATLIQTRLFQCHSYAEVLQLFAEYVTIT